MLLWRKDMLLDRQIALGKIGQKYYLRQLHTNNINSL